MPSLIQITTSPLRRFWLEQCSNRVRLEPVPPDPNADPPPPENAEDRALIRPLIPRLEALAQQWAQANNAVTDTLGDRRTATANAQDALYKLGQASSQARSVMAYRMKVEDLDPGFVDKFGLKTERPSSFSRKWILIAEDIIRGNAEAVEAGHPTLTSPTTETLTDLLAAARDRCHEVDNADRTYQSAQQTLRQVGSEVEELALDIAAYLRYRLRRLEASERRRIMRHFGYLYRGDPLPEETEPNEDPANGQSETNGQSTGEANNGNATNQSTGNGSAPPDPTPQPT